MVSITKALLATPGDKVTLSNPPAFSRASIVERGKNLSCLWRFKASKKGLVHNFIILANCWNHDWRPKSNGSIELWCPQKMFRTHSRYYQVPTGVHRGTIINYIRVSKTQVIIYDPVVYMTPWYTWPRGINDPGDYSSNIRHRTSSCQRVYCPVSVVLPHTAPGICGRSQRPTC